MYYVIRYLDIYLITKIINLFFIMSTNIYNLRKRGNTMNDLFKALSDPSRRRIIQLLKNGDLSAGEIAEHFDMTKPSISHHLNLLRQAGLVVSEKQGQNVIYSLNATTLQDALTFFFDLIHKEDTDHEN